MAKVFVQAGKNENLVLSTFHKLCKKYHGEFFGHADNDGRLLFGFAKKSQALKFRNELSIYKVWYQVAK